MGRHRVNHRDQERKARRKRKLNNKEGDASVDAHSFPIQPRQRRTTPSPEAIEAAPNVDGGSTVSVEAVATAGDSVAVPGQSIPSKEEEKQTTVTSLPSMATNPASKMSKQEKQRLKMRQRKEQHKAKKAKKARFALAAQQLEEERKRVAQALT
jgi:hypothetical protein